TLTVAHCKFADNLVAGTSIFSPGGGILSDAGSTVTVRQSTFTGNRAIDGGGIAVWGGSSAVVSHSPFAGNMAHGHAGGPGLDATPADVGGALFVDDESILVEAAGSILTVEHSGFTGNQAQGGNGGAGGPGVDGGNGGGGVGGAIGVRGVMTVAEVSHSVF